MPEVWQQEPQATAGPAGNVPGLVDRLLASLEAILTPVSGNRRQGMLDSDDPSSRLALLSRRVNELPPPARAVMQRVLDEVGRQLLEIRRLGSALQDAVVESDEARRAAEHYAMTDPLTGVLNRRGFELQAAELYRETVARGEAVLLIFVDIDQMKQINDRGGHEAGDRAIQVAAEALRRSFRARDLIVRWGGDEFAVLSAGNPMGAAAASERIRVQARRVCAEREVQPPVCLSIGAVRRAPGEHGSLEQLMARADQAMYEAKQARPSATALKSAQALPIA